MKKPSVVQVILCGVVIYFLFPFVLIVPGVSDVINAVYETLTFQHGSSDQPLFKELYEAQRQGIFCNSSDVSDSQTAIAKKYIPLGITKKQAIEILEHQGFNTSLGPAALKSDGTYDWEMRTVQGSRGDDGVLIQNRMYYIQIHLKDDKVVYVHSSTYCMGL